mmetsp:Transcript_10864/g.5520  ORF Transcript_10864/g.5520 Transcript_10864/m.5520 type:complete len:113 (+) Transcript_10864:10-348(+)
MCVFVYYFCSCHLLHDDGLEVTADRIDKIIKASGNDVETFWPMLFARALEGKDITALLTCIGTAPAVGAAAPTTTTAPVVQEEEQKVEEPEEDLDEAMEGAMDLFGEDEDEY